MVGVRFGHLARRVDFAIECDERALAAGGGSRRQPYRVQKVHLRVGAQRIERALRAGDYDRLVTVNG
jgi:hypothetical protein